VWTVFIFCHFSQDIGEWPENQILIPDWTYFHCPGATLVLERGAVSIVPQHTGWWAFTSSTAIYCLTTGGQHSTVGQVVQDVPKSIVPTRTEDSKATANQDNAST